MEGDAVLLYYYRFIGFWVLFIGHLWGQFADFIPDQLATRWHEYFKAITRTKIYNFQPDDFVEFDAKS